MTGGGNRTLLNTLAIAGAVLLMCWVPAQAEPLQRAIEAFDFEEYENAAQWLKPWAEKGEADAQYRLGIILEDGLGAQKNVEDAIFWYQKAARSGHVGARKRLRKLQKSAIADDGQESVAFEWYLEKANQGNVDSQYQLGYMYETGWSTPKDETKAARWYETAAADDHAEAQLRLGMMYMVGAGVALSDIQASRWLREAAKQDNKLAVELVQRVLDAPANIMLDGSKIVATARELSQKDAASARQYVRRAVSDAQAKFEREEQERRVQAAKSQGIASATERADKDEDPRYGLDARGRKTLAWYQRHADRGNIDAQLEMARRNLYADELPLDMQQALGWYQTAASQENVKAQYILGMFNLYGISTEQNLSSARQLLERASNAGNEEASYALTNLDSDGAPHPDESIAVWWLRQLADRDAVAQEHLGQLYDQGRGVHPNTTAAVQWLKLADSNPKGRRTVANPPVPPVIPVAEKKTVRAPEAMAAAEQAVQQMQVTAVDDGEAMAASGSEPPATRLSEIALADDLEENSLVVWETGAVGDANPKTSFQAEPQTQIQAQTQTQSQSQSQSQVLATENADTFPDREQAPMQLAQAKKPQVEPGTEILPGGSPFDDPEQSGGTALREVTVKMLELEKLKSNWMWLLGLAFVLLVTPFFFRGGGSADERPD